MAKNGTTESTVVTVDKSGKHSEYAAKTKMTNASNAKTRQTQEVGQTPKTQTTTAAKMKSQPTGDVNQLQNKYDQRQNQMDKHANKTLNTSLNTEKAGYLDAYNKSLAGEQEAGNKGQEAYNAARQDTNQQADRTGRGMDSFADVRGLNRQDNSQQSLNLNRARQTINGRLLQGQQQALADNQRRQDMLLANYQNRVAEAVANRDFKSAAALLDNYKNQQNFLQSSAEVLASYGNFAGYSLLYGSQTAGTMRDLWAAQNPELAYNIGALSKSQYKQKTGKDAPDVQSKEEGGPEGGIPNWWDTAEGRRASGYHPPAPTGGAPTDIKAGGNGQK